MHHLGHRRYVIMFSVYISTYFLNTFAVVTPKILVNWLQRSIVISLSYIHISHQTVRAVNHWSIPILSFYSHMDELWINWTSELLNHRHTLFKFPIKTGYIVSICLDRKHAYFSMFSIWSLRGSILKWIMLAPRVMWYVLQ